MGLRGVLWRALASGTAASLTSTAALVLAAEAERKGRAQPTNATSHWLHGEAAAAVERLDLAHTGVGYATHHAATVFWALLYEARLATRGKPQPPAVLLGEALLVAGVAAAVDYGATPKRFTPGWELVLSKRGMAVAYGAMAAGLAIAAAGRDRVPRPAAPRPVRGLTTP